MALLRPKSGKPNASEYQRPLVLQRFRSIARILPGNPSEQELAHLALHMQNYMEDHFGRYSPKPRLMTRLPASLFRDLRDDGALAKIFRIALKYKREMNWSEIDFKNPETNEAIQGLFLTIEYELKQMGILQHPRVHFHNNVPPELVSTLSRILTNHGGEVVSNREDATHLVQFDPEVDGKQSQEIEADYLRTLKMQPEDGIAFVHWWYYPDSYDEWIPLQDVEGQPPDEDELNRKPSQWRVCCRFIRDAELFNEWGNELDYEVEDESADNMSGDKKKKSDKNKNKARKQEELARKRKEGLLPEFIETTGTVMADEPRPTENPAIKRLRVAEMHNSNHVVESGVAEHAANGSGDEASAGSFKGPVAMQIAESKDNADVASNGKQHPQLSERASAEAGSSGRKRYRPSTSGSEAVPDWFDANQASSVERRYLPEFFDGKSKQKTTERYLEIRNMIINLYKQTPDQYLSATTARKHVPGDATSALRIHELLDSFGIINNRPKAEQERPQDMFPTILNDTESEDLIQRYARTTQAAQQAGWSKVTDEALLAAVAQHGDDWKQVATKMNGQFKAEECMLRFCQLPIRVKPEPQVLSTDMQSLAEVLARPDAIEAACNAAWDVLRAEFQESEGSTKSSIAKEAAHATAAGLAAAAARRELAVARETLNHMVDDYVASRLQSLEEKAKSLEEMEKWVHLESEKIELERRDLHIQRAKHALNIQPPTSTLR